MHSQKRSVGVRSTFSVAGTVGHFFRLLITVYEVAAIAHEQYLSIKQNYK